MAHSLMFRRSLLLSIWALAPGVTAAAQPLKPGEAVATCFSGSSGGDVVGILDINDPAQNGAIVDKNWNPLRGPHWTITDLGTEVFGIALDDAPSPRIYVTATRVYNSPFISQNPPAPGKTLGEVHQLDPAQWPLAASHKVFATLPNTGQGLGNITYDRKQKQFFVTNFYDGRIYRIDSAGVVDLTNPLDPGSQFVGPAPAPIAERVWGVGVFQDRVYFGTWGPPGQVYSVAINPTTGDFSGPISSALLPSATNEPIADIEFSTDGKMLIAERGVVAPGDLAEAHGSRVLEFSGGNPWVPTGHNFLVGIGGGTNSAGGVDYVCEGEGVGKVVATGDALHLNFNDQIYGLQIFPATGGNVANSFLVDLDNQLTQQDKRQIGDVDVYNTCDRQCGEFLVERVICETDSKGKPTGKFKILFRIKNLFNQAVFHSFLVGLPGGVTANPSYFPVAAGSDGDLDPGEVSQLLTTTISGATAGQVLSFQITLHNQDLVQCCALPVTVPLPRCDCAQVLSNVQPSCTFKPFGWTYSFTLQSLFQQGTPAFILITPDTPKTATFTPPVIPFTGNPTNVSLKIGNASPGQQVCFLVSLHTKDFDLCCSIRQCVTLPNWFIDDIDWEPIGDSSLVLEEGDLVVFSPIAAPGVVLPLVGQTGVELFWQPIAPAVLGPGDSLEQTLVGRFTDRDFDSPLAATRAVKTATGAELRASFPELGATGHRWEFFRAGERVLTVPGVGSDVPAICNGCGVPSFTTDSHFSVLQFTPASEESSEPCDGPGYPCLFSGFTFPDAFDIRIGLTAPSVAADEVRVFPEHATNTVASFSELRMRASGIPSFTLTGFRGARDCNGNGIDDYFEITRGGGLDLDRDGTLDECGVASQPVRVDLSTGFDQSAGAALAPGTDDDDWRLVAPGAERPAVVIAAPNAAWPAPLGQSRWIGAETEAGRSGPARNYRYERRFCLAQGAHDVSLALQLLADDRALVFLNGREISGLGGAFRRTPLAVQRSGAAGDGLFVAGDNDLVVEVRDPGRIATGFTLAGSVTALDGACQP